MIAFPVDIGHAAVGGNEQCAVADIAQIVDAGNILAGRHVRLPEIITGNIKMIDMIRGRTDHQRSVRCKGTAVEQLLLRFQR